MKIKSYIFIGILFFLFSCAEEGPYTLGKWDYSLEATKVSYTTAEATIKIPISANNIMTGIKSVYLVDREYHYPDVIPESQRTYGSVSGDYGSYVVSFQQLTPNTTYYILIKPDSNVDVSGISIFPTLYTGYSFKTPAITEDIYSSITNDIIIETSDLSYSTAKLTVNITKVNSVIKSVKEAYLVNREYHYPEVIPDDRRIKAYSMEATREGYQILFMGLAPSTTYYFVIKPVWDMDFGIPDADQLLYTSHTLTTPEFSDDNLISEIKYSFYRETDSWTYVQVFLPNNIYVQNMTLCASLSPDMTDKQAQPKNQGSTFSPIFQFRRLDKKKYYFQLCGDFWLDGIGSYSLGYKEIDLGSIDFSDIEN